VRVTDFFVAAQAIRYDGTNAAAVNTFVQTANAQVGAYLGWENPTVTESAGVLTVTTRPPEWALPLQVATGQWLVLEDSRFQAFDHPVFTALHRRNQPNITTVGVAPIPGIAALSNVQVNVDLPLAFSATGAYQATAYLVGATAGISIGLVGKLDVDTVRVRVDATVAFSGSAQVLVVATGDPA